MINILYYFLFTIVGLIIGSFLNVLIYRLPRNISIVKPSSFCPKCNKKIAFYDNIPFFSYIFLMGKCRNCGSKIPIRYPIVEVLTAFLFALNYYFFNISLTCLSGIIFTSALIAVSFIDIDFQIIPNQIVLPLTLVGVALSIIINPSKWWVILSFSAGAFLFMFLITLIYPKGMGMGDVKLSLMCGAFLVQKIVPGLFIGFLAGSLFGVIMIIIKKKKLKQAIAFGPFISLGALTALFLGDKIISWYLNFI